MQLSPRWDFRHWSRVGSITNRTAVYGSVRTVVWEGRRSDPSPYPDLSSHRKSADKSGQRSLFVARSYQVKRSVNCNCRAVFCEFLRLRIPVDESGWVSPGIFSTLKKSALKRSTNRSVIRVFLNSDASRLQSLGPGINWLRHGCSPVSSDVRCKLPSLSFTNTVLVS